MARHIGPLLVLSAPKTSIKMSYTCIRNIRRSNKTVVHVTFLKGLKLYSL